MTEAWNMLCIFGLALITLVTRSFFFISDKHWKLPEVVVRGLQFAPIAALSAVIFPEIFIWQGEFAFPLTNAKIYGALAGGVFFMIKRGKGHAVFGTIVVGMCVYIPLHLGIGWN